MKRKTQFNKNLALEALLDKINSLLVESQKKILSSYTAPVFPPVFIVGCPRSGTTLLIQWLAESGCFTYPSNLISRFYGSPYIGGLVQRMLIDPRFAFNEEMNGVNIDRNEKFKSNLGKTNGLLAPNEFWYFWRRFFHYGENQYLDDSNLSRVNIREFLSELASLEDVFKLPLLMKALIVNWNLEFIAEKIENAIFLYVKRDSLFNIQSLLEARLQYFNDIQKWYSFKPLEYEYLKNHDPIYQVAGQVYFTNKAIRENLSTIPSSRWLEIEYEDLCHSPKSIWENVSIIMSTNGYPLRKKYKGASRFGCQNELRMSESEKDRACRAYGRFTQGNH